MQNIPNYNKNDFIQTFDNWLDSQLIEFNKITISEKEQYKMLISKFEEDFSNFLKNNNNKKNIYVLDIHKFDADLPLTKYNCCNGGNHGIMPCSSFLSEKILNIVKIDFVESLKKLNYEVNHDLTIIRVFL